MHRSLRQARESYEHADSPYLLCPYPLVEDEKTRILFASSPNCHAANRPVIVIQKGSYIFLQYRTDRWQPVCLLHEELREKALRWVNTEAFHGFTDLQRDFHQIFNVWPYVDLRTWRCGMCGSHTYTCGLCPSCADAEYRAVDVNFPGLRDGLREARRTAEAKKEIRA